jgi:hypothetical protein
MTTLSAEIEREWLMSPNELCKTRRVFLSELAEKSDEVAAAASKLATLAALDGKAMPNDKVDFSNIRTHLKALMHESEEIHEKLKAHRDEHGC